MSIKIPADLTIVTLRHGSRTLEQRWSEAHAGAVFRFASALLKDRLDIEFTLASCVAATEEMPHGVTPIAVDTSGYHFLAAVHRAGEGARVLLVDRLAQSEVGGQARHETRVCMVSFSSDVPHTGRKLAHELAHLLEVPHVDDRTLMGPGNERRRAVRATSRVPAAWPERR